MVRALLAAAAAQMRGFTEHQILSRSSRVPGTGWRCRCRYLAVSEADKATHLMELAYGAGDKPRPGRQTGKPHSYDRCLEEQHK